MANRRYIVEPALEEREGLLAKTGKGNPAARANLKGRTQAGAVLGRAMLPDGV